MPVALFGLVVVALQCHASSIQIRGGSGIGNGTHSDSILRVGSQSSYCSKCLLPPILMVRHSEAEKQQSESRCGHWGSALCFGLPFWRRKEVIFLLTESANLDDDAEIPYDIHFLLVSKPSLQAKFGILNRYPLLSIIALQRDFEGIKETTGIVFGSIRNPYILTD